MTINVLRNVNLALYSNLKIGGTGLLVYVPETEQEFIDLIITNPSIPIIAGGSNTLISNRTFAEICLLQHAFFPPKLDPDNILEVSAPQCVSSLLSFCARSGISGIEYMAGVPRVTIGGALYQNFGAFGCSLGDHVVSVTALVNKSVVSYQREDCAFAYRSSIFKDKRYPIISARIACTPCSNDEWRTKLKQYLDHRKKAQPLALPNIGCIFKNPPGQAAGKLIDEAGLRGLSIGGAKVWESHANFIVNTGTASFEDVKALIARIKDEVYAHFDVTLEPEITCLE